MSNNFGISEDFDKQPVYCIKLKAHEFELTKGKSPKILKINGHDTFDVRSKHGGLTGEKVCYIIWE